MSQIEPQRASSLRIPLSFLHRPAAPEVAEPWLLVLLHGVGSHEADLFGLAPYMPPQFHVLSLRAPYTMAPGAYAWFEFQVEASGRRIINEGQERESRFLLGEVLPSAAAQLGTPAERVVAGGFSQGGIMSLSLLLTQPDKLSAAMVMHSRLLPEIVSHVAPVDAFVGKSLWVSHGTDDNVIPLAAAQQIRAFAGELPLALAGNDFPGAHEIRPAELEQAVAWLHRLATQLAQ